ncbi:MAG TPA: MM0924 family protein [Blastocatellia bacterium]
MRNFLENRLGKEIEIQCEGTTVKGKVTKIEGNVLHLQKDDETCYVNIEKIVIVWDSREKKAQPPGFLSKSK